MSKSDYDGPSSKTWKIAEFVPDLPENAIVRDVDIELTDTAMNMDLLLGYLILLSRDETVDETASVPYYPPRDLTEISSYFSFEDLPDGKSAVLDCTVALGKALSHCLSISPNGPLQAICKLIAKVDAYREYQNIPEHESIQTQVRQRLKNQYQNAIDIFQTTGNVTHLFYLVICMQPIVHSFRFQVFQHKFLETDGIEYLSSIIAHFDLLKDYSSNPHLLEGSIKHLLMRSSRLKTSEDVHKAAELCKLIKERVPELLWRELVVQVLVQQSKPWFVQGRVEILDQTLKGLKDQLELMPQHHPSKAIIIEHLEKGMIQRMKLLPSGLWNDFDFDGPIAATKQYLHQAHLQGETHAEHVALQRLSQLYLCRAFIYDRASDRYEAHHYERMAYYSVQKCHHSSPAKSFENLLIFVQNISGSGDIEDLAEAVAILGKLQESILSESMQCTEGFLKALISVGYRLELKSYRIKHNPAKLHLHHILHLLAGKSLGPVSEDLLQYLAIFFSDQKQWEHGNEDPLVTQQNYDAFQMFMEENGDNQKASMVYCQPAIETVIEEALNHRDPVQGAQLLDQASFFASSKNISQSSILHSKLAVGYMKLHFASQDSKHINQALDHSTSAIMSANNAKLCLDASKNWAMIAMARKYQANLRVQTDWSFGLDAMIGSFVALTGLEVTVTKRHHFLRELPQQILMLVKELINDGWLAKALESLEKIRGLVWNQIGTFRTPLDDLWSCNPAIANRLETLSQSLEIAARRTRTLEEQMLATDEQKLANELKEVAYCQMDEEWKQLVYTVQTTIPGFRHFLQPPCFTDWSDQLPETGLVAVIVVSLSGCDAIILGCNAQPARIPLPGFSKARAEDLQARFQSSLVDSNLLQMERVEYLEDVRVMRPASKSNPTPSQIVCFILQELWTLVVKPILQRLRFPPSKNFDRRIWWCPTGPLVSLPLHAAGIYMGEHCESVLDHVVSSYIPTISTLTDCVKRSQRFPVHDPAVCMVSQAEAPRLPPIPGTRNEINHVAEILDTQPTVKALRLEDQASTKKAVLEAMNKHSWMHLACHGLQDSKDPMKSGFALADGRLELSKIIELNLKHAEFAFLSACQTSTGDISLSDESIHLAAAMLAAGYRGVVGTMWSITDQHAPQVAADFYQELLVRSQKEGVSMRLDGKQAAYALHHAVQKLRARIGNSKFFIWAPYVHFGL